MLALQTCSSLLAFSLPVSCCLPSRPRQGNACGNRMPGENLPILQDFAVLSFASSLSHLLARQKFDKGFPFFMQTVASSRLFRQMKRI
jgi:hypothetical protein